jgi:hypothetical protein
MEKQINFTMNYILSNINPKDSFLYFWFIIWQDYEKPQYFSTWADRCVSTLRAFSVEMGSHYFSAGLSL